MKCQMRGKNPTTTYAGIIVNGGLTEYALCGECVQRVGYGNFLYPFALDPNSLFGSFFGNSVPEMTNTVRYPGYGSSFGEIVQSDKVGCVECYNTFRDRVTLSARRIHSNIKHSGKRLSSRALRVKPEARLSATPQEDMEFSRKRKELHEAIESQDFERAATPCDETGTLEEGGKV